MHTFLINCLKIPVRTLFSLLYQVDVVGLENYHAAGPRVLIVANHVSLLDGLLFYLFFPDRPTFAINPTMAKKWYFRPFLAFVDLFLVDPTNPISMKSLIKFLKEDRKAVIFPEGRITVSGSLMKIYEGPGMVADRASAMVLPVGIEGPQYSPLGYLRGAVRIRHFPKITLRFLPPRRLPVPEHLQGNERRRAATRALTDIMRRIAFENCNYNATLFEAVIDAMHRHGPSHIIIEDINHAPLSYRELLMRSFILGNLMKPYSQPGEHVGLMLPNVSATLIALLACHCRGRVPAMLNFTTGNHGLITACETGHINVVFTSRKFVESAELQAAIGVLSERVKVIYLEDLAADLGIIGKIRGLVAARFPRTAYAHSVSNPVPDESAVILFTSGSEGIPKGVVLSHANLLANRAQVQSLIALTSKDVVFNVMPAFHAFGLLGGILLPLLDGAKIFFYPTPLHYRLIPQLCYDINATVLFGTNTFLAGYARHAHPYDFNEMRFVICGAEKLQEDTRRVWADKLGQRVLEGYGATEAGPVVAVNTPMENRPGSVGQLLTGIAYYIEPVEGIEQGGRLVISGPNVMKGYLFHGGDGELAPPWTQARGSGWYDTGDIVTIDDEGFVHILGRAKRFANIGGEMVSLRGVEELAIAACPENQHAAVTTIDARKGEQIVLVTENDSLDHKSLVTTARRLGVSGLSVPRQILCVEAIPLLGSGKFDYHGISKIVKKKVFKSTIPPQSKH